MADWISPDGFTDGSGLWFDEVNAYDDDTGTYAYVQQNGNIWTQACYWNFSVDCTNVTKIRIWISKAVDAGISDFDCRVGNGIDIDEIVFGSPIAEGQWVEGNVNTVHTVNYIWLRFQGQGLQYGELRVHELQAYGDGGPVPPPPPTPTAPGQGALRARSSVWRGQGF